jgi:proteasome lid subunit RPN8/RPN11
MTPAPIQLPRKLLQQLLHQAQATPDLEICGLIGLDETDQQLYGYPIDNSDPTPQSRYQLDSQQHIAAMTTMRELGQRLFAIYHSHPSAPAEPSAADIAQASYPDALQLIISLNTRGVLALRAFSITEQTVHEHRLELVEQRGQSITVA